jgi:aerobic carbon-monoxide dehydrogenase medium subunit
MSIIPPLCASAATHRAQYTSFPRFDARSDTVTANTLLRTSPRYRGSERDPNCPFISVAPADKLDCDKNARCYDWPGQIMKARNFRYTRPSSLQHALQILADAGDDAVAIAGGQSLLAGLNMRLSAPKLLVDIGNLSELAGQSYAEGIVRLGALTRHRELIESQLIGKHVPLLALAAPYVGHVAIRNRGTLGGSLAYADPAAELPACLVALDAIFVLRSRSGEREVAARDFYKGLFETDLRAGELIVAVKVAAAQARTEYGFAELSRRHGDFALVGLAAVAMMQDKRIQQARLVYLGCVERARVAHAVSAAVAGLPLPMRDARALDNAIRQDLRPQDSPGLRADTKRRLAAAITARVLNSLTQGQLHDRR